MTPENHFQVKHPPEERMLLPVVPGLDPAVVIPPSTETEQESTEPTIAPAAQLATAVSSKDPFVSKHCQGKKLSMRSAKSNNLTSTSLSYPELANNQTTNDCSFEDEDEEIHETVSSDPNYYEQNSYDENFSIMPHFKPVNYWNKDIE